MPASSSAPSPPSVILPPISNTPFVQPNYCLTVTGLNIFQQIWAAVFGGGGITPGLFLLGFSDGINFNVAGDKPINLNLPAGAIGWRAALGMVYGTSGSFSAAEAGLYSLAFKGGTTLIGQTALSGITATGPNVAGATASLTPGTTAIWNYSTIYLNVGTAQGATSQGNFYLYGYPVY